MANPQQTTGGRSKDQADKQKPQEKEEDEQQQFIR
jgi:hypothetical protein